MRTEDRSSPAHPEDPKERLNRKLGELLQELRVALPGVEILFAFLLILPFSGGFPQENTVQQAVYYGAFLSAALSSALLIAPSAYHRLRWRYMDQERLEDKERMLVTSGRLAVAGLVFLGLSMTGVVFLISDLLFGLGAAIPATGTIAVAFAWLWYALPLFRRLREGRYAP